MKTSLRTITAYVSRGAGIMTLGSESLPLSGLTTPSYCERTGGRGAAPCRGSQIIVPDQILRHRHPPMTCVL